MKRRSDGRRQRRGLTAVELLIVILMLAVLLPTMIKVYMSARRFFDRATSVMDACQAGRLIVERLKRDIRESSWWIKVEDGTTLKFTTFYLDSKGCLQYDPRGLPLENDPVTYTLAGDTLLRNDREVGEGITCLRFTIISEFINTRKIPTVKIDFTVRKEDDELEFSSRVVPRHLASWARDPRWVTNSRGQPTVYQY